MIGLCNNAQQVYNSLEVLPGSECLKEIMKLYLESYGVSFDFNQFYIQYEDGLPTALFHRYNCQVNIIASDKSDKGELVPFIKSFSGCSVIADGLDVSDFDNGDYCLVMSKYGEISSEHFTDIRSCTDAKVIAELVCGDDKEKMTDFFLNTAHQLRHSKLRIECMYVLGNLVCAVGASDLSYDISALTFVYTDEYFRGNGYMKRLLSHVCENPRKKYVLLCEKHNAQFYKKCGFMQIKALLKFDL